jgi:hypothetical protein
MDPRSRDTWRQGEGHGALEVGNGHQGGGGGGGYLLAGFPQDSVRRDILRAEREWLYPPPGTSSAPDPSTGTFRERREPLGPGNTLC